MPELSRFLRNAQRELRIPAMCVAELLTAALASYPLETGGVLLGRRRGHHATITQVVGPGPAADHEVRRFVPDSGWQSEQVAAFWHADRSLQYLGDWHTHPNGSLSPSPVDLRTLSDIARFPAARQDEPVMLIVALGEDVTVRVGCTTFVAGQPRPVRVVIADHP